MVALTMAPYLSKARLEQTIRLIEHQVLQMAQMQLRPAESSTSRSIRETTKRNGSTQIMRFTCECGLRFGLVCR